jgi:hypothetical protein
MLVSITTVAAFIASSAIVMMTFARFALHGCTSGEREREKAALRRAC